MLKRSILLSTMLFVALMAGAVPAKRGVTRMITLSDGTTMSARLVGDEHGHYWLGVDGNAYQALGTDGICQQIDGKQVLAKARERRNQRNARRVKRLAPRRTGTLGNYTGQKKGLIILVNFSGTSFKSANDNALYQRIANEKNFKYNKFKGSMYDYFYDQSEGQFELTFDVVGPVTVKNSVSYYGKNDSEGNDLHPAEMVIEALKLVDSQVNFADYDWDGDREVDQVYVVYAGKGEADGGAATTIWPHEWTLSEAEEYNDGNGPQTLDGVKIDTYACGAELDGQAGTIAGIGTMCHEFSHCLGYPDFYDIDYSGGQGMFDWDLMDDGSYNGEGFLPAGYTSYERWVAGWKEPIELTSSTTIANLKALQDGGESYIIYNKGHRDEFFMLENRQLVGWDAEIPGAGLLILHVDYSESVWAENMPNDDPKHQRMTWIAADNKYQYTTYQGDKYYTPEGAANDPFPYGSVNAFGPSTTPAAKFYNKNVDGTYFLDASIENITQNNDGTVSFRFRGASNVATPQFSPKAGHYAEAQRVSISCSTMGASIYYTIDGTTPTNNSNLYSTPITVTETTTIRAIAISPTDGEESLVATAKFTIGESGSNPDTKTFKRVESTDELESGMRYIIACESKQKAAGVLNNSICASKDVKVADDVITIDNNVMVYVLEGDQTNGWTFFSETDQTYLYATDTKKLAEDTEPHLWTLSDGTEGVIMSYGGFGTMLYNVNSPRFTIYTSNPNASMIQAHLFMEYSDGEPSVEKEDVEMSFYPAALTVTIGEDYTQPTLTTNPEGLQVTYESSNTDVATVSSTGELTVSGTGYTVITASFAGNDNYNAATASYALTVKNASTPDPIDPTTRYQLVTDAAILTTGNRVVMAYIEDTNVWALSNNQKTNNREATTDVTLNDDGTLQPGSDVQVITIEEEDGCFFFYVDEGYLYAAGSGKSKNYLRTSPTADDNAKAAITISPNGDAAIVFQGVNTNNHLRFNPNGDNPIFSCYSPTSTIKSLPRIYRALQNDDTPTGVGKLDDGRWTRADMVIYNLSGQRLAAPRKGVNIINGKRVVLR